LFHQLSRKIYRKADDVDKSLFGLQGLLVSGTKLQAIHASGWGLVRSGDFRGFVERLCRSIGSATAGIVFADMVHRQEVFNGHVEAMLEVEVPEDMTDVEFSELVRELQILRT
jgi:hypothetical protein